MYSCWILILILLEIVIVMDHLHTLYFVLIILQLLTPSISQESGSMTLDDISVKALGHSGKISITKTTTNSTNGTEINEVVMDFSSLIERDINGTEVGTSGPNKHSYNNFAQMDFTISEMTTIKYQNLTALTFNLFATNLIEASTSFQGILYIFNDTGSIKAGEREFANVDVGTVKFSVEINNWPFCEVTDQCPGPHCCKKGQTVEVGKYLDFEMEIKGKDAAKKTNNNKKYSLGGGSNLILFDSVLIDGNWTTLDKGYPKYSTEGSKEIYTFRFPKFNDSLIYDPLVNYDGTTGATYWWVLIVAAIVVLGLVGVFLVCYFRNKNLKLQESLINNDL